MLRTPEIDRLIVASEWVKTFYRDEPALLAKARACPCGVDARFWSPTPGRERARAAVVYWKSGDEAFCERVEQIVRSAGLEPQRVRLLVRDVDL